MRIQEVEVQVGITKKNIRFYEQEGLISPKRNPENSYREYSEEDVQILKQIRLFRRLGVPICEIRKIQNGTLTVSDAMQRHTVTLNREIDNLKLCYDMCQTIANQQLSLAALNPDQYLCEMDTLEAKGAKFMNHQSQDIRKKVIGPIIAAIVMIALMVCLAAIFLWGNSVDPIPLPLLLFFLFFPLAVCVGVVIALFGRIRELKNGEADDADKY